MKVETRHCPLPASNLIPSGYPRLAHHGYYTFENEAHLIRAMDPSQHDMYVYGSVPDQMQASSCRPYCAELGLSNLPSSPRVISSLGWTLFQPDQGSPSQPLSPQAIGSTNFSLAPMALASLTEDPYTSTRLLGSGGGGFVDEVVRKSDPSRVCYARKQVYRHGSLANRALLKEQLISEARIIQQLRHRHIVRVVDVYVKDEQLAVVMLPVADIDLGEYLKQVDGMERGPNRDEARTRLCRWPGCLVRALGYLHEMRVMHRDIKPLNVLIEQDDVYLTDFGISAMLSDDGDGITSDTITTALITRLYAPHDKLSSGSRRGRKADVYSLGCIFLEISTALIAKPGSRHRFSHFCLERSGSRPYADNGFLIMQWMRYLWAVEYTVNGVRWTRDEFASIGTRILDIAFLMLDPDATQRITSRQMISLISSPRLGNLERFNKFACDQCHLATGFEDVNVPLHSVVKYQFETLGDPEDALRVPAAKDWEDAKNKWLEYHMWWPLSDLTDLSVAQLIDQALER
jgi:serine/threonine protein kinase